MIGQKFYRGQKFRWHRIFD